MPLDAEFWPQGIDAQIFSQDEFFSSNMILVLCLIDIWKYNVYVLSRSIISTDVYF